MPANCTLTWMFIGVIVEVVKTWAVFPIGGNIVKVFSEKKKEKAASTVGREGWSAL